jgi:hypothetical protein
MNTEVGGGSRTLKSLGSLVTATLVLLLLTTALMPLVTGKRYVPRELMHEEVSVPQSILFGNFERKPGHEDDNEAQVPSPL